MPNLIRYSESAPDRWRGRQTGRALAVVDGGRQLAVARAEAAADVQAAKADAVALVARVAMQDAAMLSQLEQQLSQLVPLAASRLQAIGDMASLGLVEVVGDTVRQVTR